MTDRKPRKSRPVSLPDAVWRRRFRRALLAWFKRNARDMPWRGTRDPYRIWVSEIMLQQTQVATVGPYFERFVTAMPDVAALAAADEDRVLRLWEGLGYYRRARQMHAAAKIIMSEHDGQFPCAPEAVRALPGVGRYTAGAVLSIAMDAREPILEANSIRVLCRLVAFRDDPTRAAAARMLWTLARELLPRKNVGTFNQALMELGSEVCTPRAPSCDACAVALLCAARQAGLQNVIPQPKKKMRYEDVRETAVVIRRGRKVLLRRCGDGERWAGLWDFPRFAVEVKSNGDSRQEIVGKVRELTGVTIRLGEHLTTIKHGVTRFRITLECYEARHVAGATRSGKNGSLKWADRDELDQYPLSATGRRISMLLDA